MSIKIIKFWKQFWTWIVTISVFITGIVLYIIMGWYFKEKSDQLSFTISFFLDISRILMGIALSLIVVNFTIEKYQRKLEKSKWKNFESKAEDTIIVSLNRWITAICIALKIEPPSIPEKEEDLKNLEENLVNFVLSKLSNERLNNIISESYYNKKFVENFTRIAQESIYIFHVFGGTLIPAEMEFLIDIYNLSQKVINHYSLFFGSQDEAVKEYFKNDLKLLISDLLNKIKLLKNSLDLRVK